MLQMTATKLGLLGFTVSHSLSLLSSSFIEEEHQLVYFFASTIVVCLLCGSLLAGRSSAPYLGLAMGCMVLARKWNQTGDKWSHLSDISDKLNAYVS